MKRTMKLDVDLVMLEVGPMEFEVPDQLWDQAMLAIERVWRRQRRVVLDRYRQTMPGHRPWAWWTFDAPADAPDFIPDPPAKLGDPGTPAASHRHQATLLRYLLEHGYIDADERAAVIAGTEHRADLLAIARQAGLAA